MDFRDAAAILLYWNTAPPEAEMLALLARWVPVAKRITPEEAQRKSLEARWAAGSMNAKQFFEATGGVLSLQGETGPKITGPQLPGIGPFPGAING